MGVIALAFVCTLTAVSCSDDSESSDGSSSNTESFAGPGSDWSIDVVDSNFTLKESTNSVEAKGTYEKLSSGFLKLTVSEATGTGAPAADTTTLALHLPDFMFLMQPFSGSQLIPMVVSGVCPTGGIIHNFVALKANDPDIVGHYGALHWDVNSSTVEVDGSFSGGNTSTNNGPDTLSSTMAQSNCSEGTATQGDLTMYLSHSGGSIINSNTTDTTQAHYMFGMESEPLDNWSDLDGEWYGLVFDGRLTPEVIPVKATISSTGSDASAALTAIDPETGNASGSLGTDPNVDALTFVDKDFTVGGRGYNGMFKLDFAHIGTGTFEGGCMADVDIQDSASKKIIICSGESPNHSSYNYNLILVYKGQ